LFTYSLQHAQFLTDMRGRFNSFDAHNHFAELHERILTERFENERCQIEPNLGTQYPFLTLIQNCFLALLV